MLNYASPQPIDRYGNPMESDIPANVPALAATVSGAIISSILTLDPRATRLEITTGNGAVALKWFGSGVSSPSVTTSNFDNTLPANWSRHYVIPVSIQGIASAGSIVGGYGAQNGLYTQVAVIPLQTSAPSSIFIAQYA